MPTHVLTLSCPDRKGIVAALSTALVGLDANILQNAEFSDPSTSTFCIRTRFEARAEHPLVSFVTMIAPSPDWFTGAADVALMTRGRWVEEVVVPLWAWDGGTDGGATYEAPNQDTPPRQSVRLLATAHFLRPGGLLPVGSATIRRVER